MATQVGNLNVRITGDGSHLSRQLKKSAGETRSFSQKVKKSGGGLEGLMSTIGKANAGFSIFRAAAVGLGAAIGGDLVENVFKGVRSLFGYDEATEKAKESTAALVKQLQMQIRHHGKTAEEIERLTLIQNKASEADAARIKQLREKIKALDETKKREDEIKKIVGGFEEQIKNFGKSADEIKLARLEMLKADKATRQHVQTLIEQRKALEAQKAAQEASNKAAEKMLENIRKQRAERAKAVQDLFRERENRILDGLQPASNGAVDTRPSGARLGTEAARRIAEITARRDDKEDKFRSEQLKELKRIRAALEKSGAIFETEPAIEVVDANF